MSPNHRLVFREYDLVGKYWMLANALKLPWAWSQIPLLLIFYSKEQPLILIQGYEILHFR